MNNEALIPLPVSVEATGSAFECAPGMKILVPEYNEELNNLGALMAGMLSKATGLNIEVAADTESKKGNITIDLDYKSDNNEAYVLNITEDEVRLSAFHPAGQFRGLQTILQLLPLEKNPEGKLFIATGKIVDYPEYQYRGLMLDVSRHFFGVEDVKSYIDYLAAYKMNVLHLHLSDDQGWRIEIKSWPKLTEIGGSTEVGGGEGGFFTQEQFMEIIAYANERYVMVVPEFEIPGHTNAALASYAELNCDGKARELYTGTKVGFSTVCTSNEITYQFVEDVVRELSEISPGPYIHIGGDESLSTETEDYITFINRVQDIVNSHGKMMIGWEEIAQADLKEGNVVQFWANEEHPKVAVEKGARVIMSPAKKIYLDMQYDSTSPFGLHWAAYIEVDDAYNWDPARYVEGIERQHILGIEAPLWSETVTKLDDIEYMVFPRMPGYAEIGWTPFEKRNWEDYRNRLAKHAPRFKAANINFYPSSRIDWVE